MKVGLAVAVPVPGDLNSNLKHRAALHRDRKYGMILEVRHDSDRPSLGYKHELLMRLRHSDGDQNR